MRVRTHGQAGVLAAAVLEDFEPSLGCGQVSFKTGDGLALLSDGADVVLFDFGQGLLGAETAIKPSAGGRVGCDGDNDLFHEQSQAVLLLQLHAGLEHSTAMCFSSFSCFVASSLCLAFSWTYFSFTLLHSAAMSFACCSSVSKVPDSKNLRSVSS